jgi:hypothetical protein
MSQSRLEVLLIDYEAARDDDRSVTSTQAALFGAAVAITAFVAAAASETCQIDQPSTKAAQENCLDVPDPLLGALPLGPLAMIAFLQVIGAVSTVRNYYLRGLEAELRRYAGGPLTSIGAPTNREAIYPASYYELLTNLMSMRRGHLGFRLMNAVMLLAILVVFGGLAVFIAIHVDTGTRITMGIVYGAIGLLMLAQAMNATVGGRRLFQRVARQHADGTSSRLPRVPDQGSSERSLMSYLLLPRVEECVKWLFMLISFVLGALAADGVDRATVVRAAVVFVAFEYLIYEARYQWNDVRGYKPDSEHPERAVRRRLPVGATTRERRRNVAASLGVAILRVLAAGGLALAFGSDVLVPVAVLAVLVFLVARVYESLRSRLEAKGANDRTVARYAIAVWTWVGVGYAIRGGAGLWLAGFTLDSQVLLLAIPMFVAYGTMFVTLTWVLEALSHYTRDADRLRASKELAGKHHLRLLVPYLDIEASTEGDTNGCRTMYALKPRGAIWAPWNIALLVAAPLSAAAGLALAAAGDLSLAQLPFVAAAAVIAAAGACGLLRMPDERWRPAAVVATASILGGLGFVADLEAPALALLPWLVVSATYVGFRLQSYDSLHAGIRPIVERGVAVYTSLLRRLVGPATAPMIGLAEEPNRETHGRERLRRAAEPHS